MLWVLSLLQRMEALKAKGCVALDPDNT